MDFIADRSGRHLLRLNSLMEVPGYVKEASIVAEDVAGLSNGQFALPQSREFPIDTPGHTFLSYSYCKSAGIKQPNLLARLTKAAAIFGIEKDIAKVDEALSTLTKSASVAKRFAISLDFKEASATSNNPAQRRGGVQGFYPINTIEEVEESALKVANERTKLPLELFAEASRNIVKAARQFAMPGGLLPRIIVRYGTPRLPDPEYVQKMAKQRLEATGDTIYQSVVDTALENPEDLDTIQYAELWLKADRQNGYKAASKQEDDPFMIFNSGKTVEMADRELERWTVLNGSAIPVETIAGVKEASVRRWFPKEIAEKVIAIVKKASDRVQGSELLQNIKNLDAGVQKALWEKLV